MNVDDVITLANNKNYLLLLESEQNNNKYFLSVLLDEEERPTNNYAVLKEVKEGEKILCQKINDPNILSVLLEDYKDQYSDLYDE